MNKTAIISSIILSALICVTFLTLFVSEESLRRDRIAELGAAKEKLLILNSLCTDNKQHCNEASTLILKIADMEVDRSHVRSRSNLYMMGALLAPVIPVILFLLVEFAAFLRNFRSTKGTDAL